MPNITTKTKTKGQICSQHQLNLAQPPSMGPFPLAPPPPPPSLYLATEDPGNEVDFGLELWVWSRDGLVEHP